MRRKRTGSVSSMVSSSSIPDHHRSRRGRRNCTNRGNIRPISPDCNRWNGPILRRGKYIRMNHIDRRFNNGESNNDVVMEPSVVNMEGDSGEGDKDDGNVNERQVGIDSNKISVPLVKDGDSSHTNQDDGKLDEIMLGNKNDDSLLSKEKSTGDYDVESDILHRDKGDHSTYKTVDDDNDNYWYQTLILPLPRPAGKSVRIHPDGEGGLACLDDGSLVMFQYNRGMFRGKGGTDSTSMMSYNYYYLVPPSSSSMKHLFVTCAAFGGKCKVVESQRKDVLRPKDCHRFVYAATRCGKLLIFRVVFSANDITAIISNVPEPVLLEVPGGAAVRGIVVGRDGKTVLLNSADGAIRVYDLWGVEAATVATVVKVASGVEVTANEMIEEPRKNGNDAVSHSTLTIKPRVTLQDVVVRTCKSQWACFDVSGDGLHVAGGRNAIDAGTGDGYELYLWDASNGTLVDKLTGPKVSIFCLSWHPFRPFLAVGTSDGIVDVWAAKKSWTSFTPDFTALERNVVYQEQEDEFDVVIVGENGSSGYGDGVGNGYDIDGEGKGKPLHDKLQETEIVDVVTIQKPVSFWDEGGVGVDPFYFPCRRPICAE